MIHTSTFPLILSRRTYIRVLVDPLVSEKAFSRVYQFMMSDCMECNQEDVERTVRVLLGNARDMLQEIGEKIEKERVNLSLLLDVQSLFVLGLSDVSLYSFALGLDDLVEEAYETFVEGYQLIKNAGLMVNNEDLDLQLGFLKNLDLKRGFSLDRRLSILGKPKAIQVWGNRIIKLRNALHGDPPRDPLREIGYGTEENDRKFPYLLRAVRRIYETAPPTVEEFSRLFYLEMLAGIEGTILPCRDGKCEEITSVDTLKDFEIVSYGNINLYYRFEGGKGLGSPWGRLTMGDPVEIVVFSREKKRGIRCVRGAV
jgi:hypothetical protein